MSVRKSDDLLADLEGQAQWYVANAGWEVADRFLDSVEATCRLLGCSPALAVVGQIKS
jgi:plasmid stabilization system protein ParE